MLARDHVKKGEYMIKDLGALDELLLGYFTGDASDFIWRRS